MKKAMEELKKIAEKHMGMSWDKIMAQAAKDTKKQQKIGDPIAKAAREASKSPKKMLKESLKDLNKKTRKK